MPMTVAQFNQHLWPGIKVFFGDEYERYPDETKDIFSQETSNKKFEKLVKMSGFGAAMDRNDGVPVDYDTMQEVYTTTIVSKTVQLAYSITQDVNEDDQYADVLKQCTKALAFSFATKKNRDGAAVLNNGFNTAFVGGDGRPLFDLNHPLVSGGVNANRPVTGIDLDEAALEAALIAIAGFTDDRGLPIAAMAKKLIVPTNLQFQADRLLNTVLRVGTTDNDINSINHQNMIPGGFSVNHFLTDTNQFTITTNVPEGLMFFNRKPLTYSNEGDFETGNMKYKGRCRYVFSWADPLGAYSSPGVS